ncbi:MAG: hypothetical protein HY393_00355 [Candidatus Diapherotrites archaeon]|nr:hypothetical protein [Candidatus Diapherotrites archaeon]
MKLKVAEKKTNPLLEREEIFFEVTDVKTVPSRKELTQHLCALEGGREEDLVIQRVQHHFGTTHVTGTAHKYLKEGRAQKMELNHLLRRQRGEKGLPEKKKPQTVPAAEAKKE